MAAERVIVFAQPPVAGQVKTRLAAGVGIDRRPQAEGDLGARMCQAFREAFAEGVRKAVIIGTDCPGLTSATLHEAFRRLDEAEAVVGPAEDGGYVLLGLTSPVRAIFENKVWSGETVLADTLADFKRLGMPVARLEPLRDVDTAEDLDALEAEHPWLRA